MGIAIQNRTYLYPPGDTRNRHGITWGRPVVAGGATPERLASERARAACVDAYVAAVRNLPFVVAVFEDDSDELTLISVYHGALAAVENGLYEAQAEVLRRFPDVPVDFHILSDARADMRALEQTTRQIYGR